MPIRKSRPWELGDGWWTRRNKKSRILADITRRQSLVDLFHEFSESAAEFLQYDNGYRGWKYTYAQLGRAASHFALRLGEHDIRKGDKVIFWSENRPEWIAAFWGCILGLRSCRDRCCAD